jgi:hypothetical protein
MEKWTVSNIDNAKYLGIIEFQDNQGEWHDFEVLQTNTRLVFGGATNIGFLESGYMDLDLDFSLDENLQELLQDLEIYYNDGSRFTTNIICNERM